MTTTTIRATFDHVQLLRERDEALRRFHATPSTPIRARIDAARAVLHARNRVRAAAEIDPEGARLAGLAVQEPAPLVADPEKATPILMWACTFAAAGLFLVLLRALAAQGWLS